MEEITMLRRQPPNLITVSRERTVLPTMVTAMIAAFDDRQLRDQNQIDFLEEKVYNLEKEYNMLADAVSKLPDYNYDQEIGENLSLINAVKAAISQLSK